MIQILFLTSINILNYLDRYLVPALLPLIQAEFLLSNEQGGRLISAFVIGYVVFSPIFGYLGDRCNRPLLMAFGVVLWSIGTITSAYVTTLLSFFLVRAALGVGEASYGTIAPGFIKDKKGGEPIAVNNALSIFFCAVPVGAALGYYLGGLIAAHSHWRNAFLFCGVPGLVLALFLALIKEAPRTESKGQASVLSGLRTILSSHMLRMAIAGYIFNAFALNGIASFVTTYGVQIGFSIDRITQVFGGILVVTGLMGTFLGGRLASLLSRNAKNPLASMMKFCSAVSILSAPPLACAFLFESPTIFLVCCFFAELLVFASVAPINSVLVLGAPVGLVTLVQGVTIFSINLFGSAVAPVMIGWIADTANLALAMQLSTIGILLSALFWWQGARAQKSQ